MQTFSRSRGKVSKKILLDGKAKIDHMREQINKLKLRIEEDEKTLQTICHHPKDHILYSADTYHHEDDYGRTTGQVSVYEMWECEICGKTESIEQTFPSNRNYTMYRYDEKKVV